MVAAEDCISICQLWSFVPIIEEFQAEIVTEKNRKYMQYVNTYTVCIAVRNVFMSVSCGASVHGDTWRR